MNGISLRILSFERPEYLASCLESVLRQTEPFADVEIYDRSRSDDLQALLARFPSVRLNRPDPPPPQHENFVRAFRDRPRQRWLCVFHDDDRLKPDFCRHMIQAVHHRPDCGAISCDGEVIDAEGNPRGGLLPAMGGDVLLRTPGEFSRWYCASFIPFPAAVYAWDENLAPWIDQAGAYGRCGDVAFFSRIVRHKPIWIRAQKDFYYRRHGGQDSSGFLWWEETKRWDLQMELAQNEPDHLAFVNRQRKARLTQRWCNAWLAGEPRPEPLRRGDFSVDAFHRFVRNNKLRILRRWLGGKAAQQAGQ